MSSTRAEKRHPRLKAEDLPTTRGDVIAFIEHMATKEPVWCMKVWATIQTTLHNEAIVAEHKRRLAWHPWRKWLHKKWLEADGLRKRFLTRRGK